MDEPRSKDRERSKGGLGICEMGMQEAGEYCTVLCCREKHGRRCA